MNKTLLKCILLSILGTGTALGVTVPFLTKSSSIKKTKWVAGKPARDYFELADDAYVTGLDKWYEDVEKSCKDNTYTEDFTDFCEQLNGKEIDEE